MDDRTIRILIVDDNESVRHVLSRLLQRVPGLQVCGAVESGERACETFDEVKPDVVVMDIRMQGIGGIEAARRISGRSPDTCIVGMSMFEEGPEVDAMRGVGIADFVPKSSCVDRLVRSILSAAALVALSRMQPIERPYIH